MHLTHFTYFEAAWDAKWLLHFKEAPPRTTSNNIPNGRETSLWLIYMCIMYNWGGELFVCLFSRANWLFTSIFQYFLIFPYLLTFALQTFIDYKYCNNHQKILKKLFVPRTLFLKSNDILTRFSRKSAHAYYKQQLLGHTFSIPHMIFMLLLCGFVGQAWMLARRDTNSGRFAIKQRKNDDYRQEWSTAALRQNVALVEKVLYFQLRQHL